MKAARKPQRLQQPASLIEFVRQFLTPQVWKQSRQCVASRRSMPRWDLQPLVLVLVAMTWAVGDSESERFVAAHGFYVMTYEARKRPGKTLAGFQKALARLPVRQLWALAQGVRDEIRRRYAERLMIDGFVPMGCDGSRIECPRSAELEARMGKGSSEASAPTAWVTAFVHLGSGLLWSWRIGKGTADERLHLRQMLSLLPAEALVVADAAYMGYELARAILQKQSFLLRMSSKVRLYAQDETPIEHWQEGLVYYWPETVQKQQQPPLLCRLIRVRAEGKIKRDVWLLTNILDQQRLSATTAARFYRWRWRNEGLFRTYKRTLKKVKLVSRTVRLVHRELEGSLLALQILLAHADLAIRPLGAMGEPAISPRKVLIEIRQEINGTKSGRRGRRTTYSSRLKKCHAERRCQKSPKASREWPRRKAHKPPDPPVFLTMNERQKTLLEKHIRVA